MKLIHLSCGWDCKERARATSVRRCPPRTQYFKGAGWKSEETIRNLIESDELCKESPTVARHSIGINFPPCLVPLVDMHIRPCNRRGREESVLLARCCSIMNFVTIGLLMQNGWLVNSQGVQGKQKCHKPQFVEWNARVWLGVGGG